MQLLIIKGDEKEYEKVMLFILFSMLYEENVFDYYLQILKIMNKDNFAIISTTVHYVNN